MKKFIISILCAAVFFIGLGNLVQETGARFKSDERALDLIKRAQTAIGGEAAIRNVRSLTMNGTAAKTFDADGAAKTVQGDLEINLQLPDQYRKMLKLRHQNDPTGEKSGDIKKEVKVIVMNDGDGAPMFKQTVPSGDRQNVVITRKGAGERISFGDKIVDGKVRKVITGENIDVVKTNGAFRQNEMFRTMLALFLTAPQGADVTFSYAGDGDVDGANCDIVEARSSDSAVKLFLDKSSHLPRMMSYQGFKPTILRINKDTNNESETEPKVFVSKLDKPETAEFQIRFSDYRAVGGVLLPHRWTQTVGGAADETIDVIGYEINPANIAEKFQNLPSNFLLRTEKKPQ